MHSAENHAQIDIFLPTKDRPILLARALSSILAQSYPHWKLYLINDGGDKTILDKVIAPYRTALGNRLNIIYHEIPLASKQSLIKHLKKSQGDFFAIHNDDDGWSRYFLETMVNYLTHPAHQSYIGALSWYHRVNEDIVEGEIIEQHPEPVAFQDPILNYESLIRGWHIPDIALFWRRKAMEQIEQDDNSLTLQQNFVMPFLKAGEVGIVPQYLAFYHLRDPHGHSPSAYMNASLNPNKLYQARRISYQNEQVRKLLKQTPTAFLLLEKQWQYFFMLQQEIAILSDRLQKQSLKCRIKNALSLFSRKLKAKLKKR